MVLRTQLEMSWKWTLPEPSLHFLVEPLHVCVSEGEGDVGLELDDDGFHAVTPSRAGGGGDVELGSSHTRPPKVKGGGVEVTDRQPQTPAKYRKTPILRRTTFE